MFREPCNHDPYVALARVQVAYEGKAVADLEPWIVELGKAALKRLEDTLATDGPVFVGDEVTLADVALVACTRVADQGGFNLGDDQRVTAWVGRVEEALKIVI